MATAKCAQHMGYHVSLEVVSGVVVLASFLTVNLLSLLNPFSILTVSVSYLFNISVLVFISVSCQCHAHRKHTHALKIIALQKLKRTHACSVCF